MIEMKLNGMELNKGDSKKIVEELKNVPKLSECDEEYQLFIKECLKTSGFLDKKRGEQNGK